MTGATVVRRLGDRRFFGQHRRIDDDWKTGVVERHADRDATAFEIHARRELRSRGVVDVQAPVTKPRAAVLGLELDRRRRVRRRRRNEAAERELDCELATGARARRHRYLEGLLETGSAGFPRFDERSRAGSMFGGEYARGATGALRR